MMYILLIIIYRMLLFVMTKGQVCEPCEEYNVCTISFTSTKALSLVNQFIWKSDGITSAICYSKNKKECFQTQDTNSFLSLTIQTESDNVVNTSITFTANRHNILTSETHWELFGLDDNQGLQHLYTCDVKIYKNVHHQPNCTYEASHKGLELKCSIYSVYPKSACDFNLRFVNIILKQMTLSYNHTITNIDPVYYTTECSVLLPQKLLVPGVLKYQVTMFPNVTTNSTTFSRKKLQQIVEGTINIELPSIKMVACPTFVEKGHIFNCTCERNDKSDIPTVVYWLNSQNTNDKLTILSGTAKENEIDYVCKAESDLGWLSIINYSPTIKDTITDELKTCHKNCTHDKVTTKGQYSDGRTITTGLSASFVLLSILIVLFVNFHKRLRLRGANNKKKEKRFTNKPETPCFDNSSGVITEERNANIPLLPLHSKGIQQLETSDNTVPVVSESILVEQVIDETNIAQSITDLLQQDSFCGTQDFSKFKVQHYLSGTTYRPFLKESLISLNKLEDRPSESLAIPQEQKLRADNIHLTIKINSEDPKATLFSESSDTHEDDQSIVDKSNSSKTSLFKLSETKYIKFSREMPRGTVIFREAEVCVFTKIAHLKQDLVELYNIPAETQLWYIRNMLMDDDKLLKDYDISPSNTVVMKSKQSML